MESHILTSVIIVSYFTGPSLEKAIASVLNSSLALELILVNNGNPPEVEEKLKEMDANPEIPLHLVTGHGNVGFAKGGNLGAKRAQGKHLLFLSPESQLPPDALEKVYAQEANLRPPFMLGAHLVDEKGVTMTEEYRDIPTPLTTFIDILRLHRFFPQYQLQARQQPSPKETSPVPAISLSFMFLRADNFRALKGFDEKYLLMEDLDLCARFRRNGGGIYFCPTLTVPVMRRPEHVPTVWSEKARAWGWVRFFHENYGHEYSQLALWALDGLILGRLGLRLALQSFKAKKEAFGQAWQAKKAAKKR